MAARGVQTQNFEHVQHVPSYFLDSIYINLNMYTYFKMHTSSINLFLDINQSITFDQGTKIRCATSARFFSCPTHSTVKVDSVHPIRQGTPLTNASAPSTAAPQRQIQRPSRQRAKETPAAHTGTQRRGLTKKQTGEVAFDINSTIEVKS